MANPNKTAAAYFAKRGRDPKVKEAMDARFAQSEMARDMAAFQAGEMSAADFEAKYNPFR